ncbi:MAG: oxidoreductase family protein [Pseudomonadales bacterium]
MQDIPRSADQFTVDWLNFALAGHLGGHKVKTVEVRDSDIPGQTAEIAKISVTYDSVDCRLPTRLIGKYTSHNQGVIDAVINVYQQYWRETSFYKELPDPGIPVPSCYYAVHDPATQTFVILMNDLAPAESPSWASTPAQVAEAVSHLPGIHGKWWNSPLIRSKDWLVQYDNIAFFTAAASAASASVPRVRQLFGAKADQTARLLDMWLDKIDRVTEYISKQPYTLVHGDYHPKQIFFPVESNGQFAVIDWQFSFVAQGAWDLIRVVTLGQSVNERRTRENELISNYHAGLAAQGVSNYSMAALEDDIRLGLIVNQMIMAIAVADTDIALVARECDELGLEWQDVILLRGEAAVGDWDVEKFLSDL